MNALYQGPEYRSWHMMKQRCLNPNSPKYYAYGGVGIRVCEQWLEFNNFYKDMGNRPAGTTLDRINTLGDYEPSNCRWATPGVQANNQKIRKDNKTGAKGVYFDKSPRRIKKWRVSLHRDNRPLFSGSFLTLQEAIKARDLAIRRT